MSHRLRSVLDTLSFPLLVGASAFLLWKLYAPPPPPPPPPLPVEDVSELVIPSASITHLRGTGPVVLVEFSDYECPFCGTYSRDMAPRVKTELMDTGALQHVFLNFPLSTNQRAEPAAQAAECAAQQMRFWEMHDRLFEAPSSLEGDDLLAKAEQIGLDKKLFAECLNTGLTARTVRADVAEGERLGVEAVPAFFLGRRQPDGAIALVQRIKGPVSFDSFKEMVYDISPARQAQR